MSFEAQKATVELRLGYKFQNKDLLPEALQTYPTYDPDTRQPLRKNDCLALVGSSAMCNVIGKAWYAKKLNKGICIQNTITIRHFLEVPRPDAQIF